MVKSGRKDYWVVEWLRGRMRRQVHGWMDGSIGEKWMDGCETADDEHIHEDMHTHTHTHTHTHKHTHKHTHTHRLARTSHTNTRARLHFKAERICRSFVCEKVHTHFAVGQEPARHSHVSRGRSASCMVCLLASVDMQD